MKKVMILMAAVALISMVRGIAEAQQEGKQDQDEARQRYEEVTVYHAVVIGDGTIEGAAKVVSIGPDRKNKADAEADEEKWKKDHPQSLRLTDVREKTIKTPVGKVMEAKEAVDKVKEAKEAVDQAKKIDEEGPLSAFSEKARKLGATLKEYGEEAMKAMGRAKEAKKGLTEMTGKISRKQLDEVNKLIVSYNESRSQLRRVEREFNAARAVILKDTKQPKGKVEIAVTGIPNQESESVLDRFPPMATLDPEDYKDRLEPETLSGKWVVWVYKNVGGKWEKQEDQSFSSNDKEEAEKHFAKVKGRAGYTATSNLPVQREKLAGTSWGKGLDLVEFGEDGSFTAYRFVGTFKGTFAQDGNHFKASGENQIAAFADVNGRQNKIYLDGRIENNKLTLKWIISSPSYSDEWHDKVYESPN